MDSQHSHLLCSLRTLRRALREAGIKVYAVEVGAHDDRYTAAIYTTRELADAHVLSGQRQAFGRAVVARTLAEPAGHEDVPAETFEEFVARHDWNEFGEVAECDLWKMLPMVAEESGCERCGRSNPVWFGPSPLWNQVMRAFEGKWNVVCPICFAELAEAKGIGKKGAWRWEPAET